MSVGAGVGRLASGPHPTLFRLLYEPALEHDLEVVLPQLLDVDAAHVVMAVTRGLLPAEVGASLLSVNRELAQAIAAGKQPLAVPDIHRGMYFLYEGEYIRRLGPQVGGSAHVARSRNDINATIFRMRARSAVIELLERLHGFTAALSAFARRHAGTLVCGFTHLQPAQPTTVGHVFSGVLGELTRTADWLAQAYPPLNRSPMGAAAGLGTSFPIDPHQVASLLGFDAPIDNSIDAVGSRDSSVHVLAPLALLGTTLSRWALDVQLWASAAYGFLDFGDDLVSTSSIMPQKRNAFVLENIRGQAVRATGALMTTLMGLKNTPFTNSVEVSGEAASHLWAGAAASVQALELATLLASQLIMRPQEATRFLEGKDTTMTALADALVSQLGLSFRTAHEVVGTLVARAPRGGVGEEALRSILPSLLSVPLTGAQLDRLVPVLSPAGAVQAAAWGGGPSPAAVEGQLDRLDARRRARQEMVDGWKASLARARERLSGAVSETMAGSAPRGENRETTR